MIMLKILIIIITTSGLSFVIGTSTPKSFDATYIITGILVLVERCLLAYILISVNKTISMIHNHVHM